MKKLLFAITALALGHAAAAQTWWLNIPEPYYVSIPTSSYEQCRRAMTEYASDPSLVINYIGCDVKPLWRQQ